LSNLPQPAAHTCEHVDRFGPRRAHHQPPPRPRLARNHAQRLRASVQDRRPRRRDHGGSVPAGGSRMNEGYLPLISALIGAVIGSASSIVTMYIQTKVRDRRERLEQASRMAIEAYKGQIEIARLSQRPMAFMPLVSLFAYHWDLVQLLDSGAE